jgi:Tfp pilus assembly protein PilF
MQKFTIDPRRLAQEGMAALQAGNPQQARACFEKVVEGKYADASIFLALAYACKSMQDASAATSAIDNVLLLEPQNLRALLFKADHLAEAGDRRAASAFYLAAIKAGVDSGTSL